jgi:hypothetical protein
MKEGTIPFDLRDYQEDVVGIYHSSRISDIVNSRQVGMTWTTVAYVLWYAMFKDNARIAVLCNNETSASEFNRRFRFMYDNLPDWMRQPLVYCNKQHISFVNGSSVFTRGASACALRGMSLSLLVLQDFAYVPNHVVDEVITSAYPLISIGCNFIMCSGFNPDATVWNEFRDNVNASGQSERFVISWDFVEGRNVGFKERIEAMIGSKAWNQEYECGMKEEN